MRAAAQKAWLSYARRWEGVTTWMYLDTKAKVTTGIGFLIDSISAAQALPWMIPATGKTATAEQIATEWRRVKAHTSWTKYNGLHAVWSSSAKLRITQVVVDGLLTSKTAEFWAGLKRSLPDLDAYPADAQLAIMDESWQNGWGFLEKKEPDGSYTWAGTRSALRARDFAAAARHVPGSGDRADFRRRLFLNAAVVETNRMDPAKLWDTETPTKPAPEGYDVTAAKSIYKRATIDQAVEASKDVTLKIDDKGNTSVSVGTNPGVDARLVLTFNSATPVNVAVWAVIVDALAKDGSDAKVSHTRTHGWDGYAAGTGWEAKANYAGGIPKPTKDGRNNRLRFLVRASAPITITNVEVTGWEMP